MKKLLILLLLFAMPAIADEGIINEGTEHECRAIGPTSVYRGAADWCSIGAFLEVRASVDDELDAFHARYLFNDFGYKMFTEEQFKFFAAFEELLGKFNEKEITATFEFYYGEALIFECSGEVCKNAG